MENLPYLLVYLSSVGVFAAALVLLELPAVRHAFSQPPRGKVVAGIARSFDNRPFRAAFTAVLIITGVYFGVKLLWWIDDPISIGLPAAAVAAIGTAAIFWTLSTGASAYACGAAASRQGLHAGMTAIAVLGGSALILSSAWMRHPMLLFSAWHHWVAYLGPAELMRAGGRIFYDFTAQYGLGPTFLFSLTCGSACQTQVYWVVAAFSIACLCCLLMMVRLALPGARWSVLAVALAAMTLASTLWVSYPPLVRTPVAVPSTTGMRFLPAVLLTLALVANERFRDGKGWFAISFPIVALCVLWSPEALLHAALIWGAYCCARSLSAQPERNWFLSALWGAGFALGAILAIAIVALAAYRVHYGVWPLAEAYAAYILYPPGPMPVTWNGPVLFALATLGLGAAAGIGRIRAGDLPGFRALCLACLLLCATMSYTLGRSHSNNFLNILPYATLVLVFCLAPHIVAPVRALAAGMIACVIAFTPLFGWGGWNRAAEFGPARIGTIDYYHRLDDAAELEASSPFPTLEAVRAFASIRERSSDPIEVVDQSYIFLAPQVWTTLHGPGNYVFISEQLRLLLMANGAQRFGRPGWMLIQKGSDKFWLENLSTVYRLSETLSFDRYDAHHFKPR